MNKAGHLTQEFIWGQLDGSQAAVEAALVAIYDRQTAEERAGAYTRENNGVGFSKFDAEFCTSLVQQIKRGKPLTPRQLEVARKKAKRYWRQLITVMTTAAPQPVEIDAPVPVAQRPIAPTLERSREAASSYASW
jgi:hypothetical protein